MNSIQQLFRLIHINFVLAKYGLGELLLATYWFAPLRFVVYLNPWKWLRDKNQTRGVRVRHALEELGPIFIKFGQMLSTRPDLFPEDIVLELTQLQDNVSPFPKATKLIQSLYDRPLNEIFSHVDSEPLASASVAQVHTAELMDGKKVIIKVLRPGIRKIIKRDIALLYTIAGLFERYTVAGRRLRAKDIVAEFEHTLLNELDLTREAANASQLRRNFENSSLLYVPEVYWPYSKMSVMVMERIHGIPVADIDSLREHGVNLKKLAEKGVEIFFTQVFRDCFFHADMHPGNIFVSTNHPSDPQYIGVDFGIMGTLTPTDQRYLAENMMAFFKRDYRRVAQLHIDSGWIPSDTRVDEFESAIRTVCEPIFERPLRDISFGQLLMRLFQVGKQFDMEIQPQLLLLQKTLFHVEGLGRQIYPDLNLWTTAKPSLEKWIKKQVGPRAFLRKLKDNAPAILEKLPELPTLIHNTLDHFNQQEIRHLTNYREQKKISSNRIKNYRKTGFMHGIGIALIATSLVCLLTAKDLWQSPLQLSTLGWTLGATGIIMLLVGNVKK